MDRDLNIGFDVRLSSEYTMIYEEAFDFQGYLFTVMPLLKSSLDKYLNLSSHTKKLLIDEV
jgi:hypothetical protein